MSSGEEENVEGIENSPIDESDPVFRSVAEADVSLDEMMSLACRQGKLDIVELLLESGAHVDYRNKAGNTPLLEACSQGHVDVARYLLDHHANIDAPTETTSDSALTWACTLGNEAIVSLLLERKANVEHRTKDGCTALMFAALAGHVKVAAMLLDHKAEINVESDSNKDSPLTFACWKGHCDVVELLLRRNANIEHRTKEGFTPLMFAALGGHTDVAAKLLEQGAKVNVPSGSNNDIPLTSACWKGHHDVVKLLLEYHSNIEHRTKDGCTPLMLAAREGHYSVAKLILDSRAEVNKPSGSENNIPLTLACWKGHTKVVELLLDHKSNIEHRNKAGCTPLMLAAREGHVETTQLLLSRGAEINKPSGSNDDTPLTLACWKGHVGVVELLLKHNSKVDHQTKTGCTPLMEATREGHVAVAKLLLDHNADVELPDNYGQSPLFMACWKGHRDVAELLLEHNANRDCRTKTGITPLFQACRENHVNVVKLLLDYGASVNATFPNSRENPLTLACEKGHAELVSLLLRRSANLECHTKKGCTPFHLSCKGGHLAIAIALHVRGADTEAPDYRNNSPLVSTMKNGHVEALEWLLNVVDHLPSEEQCQKCLMAPIEDKERHDELMIGRTKCYDLILKCKKAKEQKVQRNTELLLKELENEKERESNRKKKAAAKRRDKRRRRKAAKENEQAKELKEEAPLENRPQEVAEPPESEEESSDIEDEEEKPQRTKENHKIRNMSHNDEKIKIELDCNGKNDIHQDSFKYTNECPRGRGKLIIDEETSLVGSNDRQHQQNQDSPNDFEERKSSGFDSKSRSKKKGDMNNFPKEVHLTKENCSRPEVSSSSREVSSKESSNSTQEINTSSKDSNNSRDANCSQKEDKKKALLNNKANKSKDEKDNEIKTKNLNTVNTVRNDTKQEKSKRDSSQKHNSVGTSAHFNKTNTGTPNITTSAVSVSDKERVSEVTTGHPVSPRDRNKQQPSPKSSPESDKDTDKIAKRRSKEVSNGVDVGTSGEYIKQKTASRGSTTMGQSSTSVKTTTTENDKEQKPLPSPRSKPHQQQQVLKEESWKEVTRTTNSKTMVVQLTAPNALCGRVIGRGGSKINSITEESGAQITIGKPEPKAPTDRVITIKGSTKSVQRAKFLVTQALNTPSTSGQATNGTPTYTTTSSAISSNHLTAKGNFPALNSSSSEWPTITQANTLTSTTVVKSIKDTSPETMSTVDIPQEVSKTHSRSTSSGSSDSGYSVQPDSNKSSAQVSKTTTVAWSNHVAWKPNRATQSIGVSTSAVTTCVSSNPINGVADTKHITAITSSLQPVHSKELHCSTTADIKGVVTTIAAITRAEATTAQRDLIEPGRPLDTMANTESYVSMWSNARQTEENCDIKGPFGAIGDIPCGNSVLQETSPSFSSRRKEPLISETTNAVPRQSPPSARATKFYSPWSTQPTGITDIRRENAFSSNADKYEGALPGMELFAGSNSLFSRSIQSYPWSSGEDADQLDRARSVSWSEQPDFDNHVSVHQPSSNQSDLHNDQRPMGNAWSWGQNKATLPSALSVVCDDNTPDKQAWNNSDSTSSSQSSSRQELNSIMDNEGTSGNMWSSTNFDDNLTPTPHSSHSSSLPHPDQGTSQWNSNRGAFSAPSSPSMPRSQSQPEPTSKSPSRPSVDDNGVKSWNKNKSPRSQSSSDATPGWNHNTQGNRRSSGDMPFVSEISSTSPWLYSSRPQEIFQSSYTSREPWRESHVSPSSGDVAGILKRLTLEKYLPVFQEHKITVNRLEHMSESDLENLGIPKGPRLKLLHAIRSARPTSWPAVSNSFSNPGNGYLKTQHPPTVVTQSSNKMKPSPSIMENHNHVHAHTEPGMTPLAIKKALQKQECDNPPQPTVLPNHCGSNHSNQPLLSLMSHGRGVNQTPHSHPNHNHNHTEYGGGLPPRPHSASGNLSSAQVFSNNSNTAHIDHFPYGGQQGPYVNHVTTYAQQMYYPGGYYYYYPQQ